MTNTNELANALMWAFLENDELKAQFDDLLGEVPVEARSFNDAGILTINDGVVVRLTDGSEFQIQVVRSN